jgi:hypothetical protein
MEQQTYHFVHRSLTRNYVQTEVEHPRRDASSVTCIRVPVDKVVPMPAIKAYGEQKDSNSHS